MAAQSGGAAAVAAVATRATRLAAAVRESRWSFMVSGTAVPQGWLSSFEVPLVAQHPEIDSGVRAADAAVGEVLEPHTTTIGPGEPSHA